MLFGRRQPTPPLRVSSSTGEVGTQRTDLGLVVGSAVVGVNVWKEAIAAVTDVFGGRSSSLEATVDKGIDLAVATMQEKARALGADAVRDVRIDLEQMGGRGGRGGHLIVIAVGTAVREAAEPALPCTVPDDTSPTAGLPPFQPGR